MVGTPGRLPRFVVAAPGSGHGKTMVATGLMAALRARGLAVSPHKVGPDYIDPSYHGLAAGRVGRNLDPFLCGEELVAPLLRHGAAVPFAADIAVIEGVMGLFDGAIGRDGFASTAHVAKLVEAPVILVVDCAASARSVGATVHGFATYDPEVNVAGVILNNVASPRHEAEARAGVERTGLPVLGSVPRLPQLVVPSRHLGLVPVAERHPDAVSAVDALADLITEYVDLDALLAIALTAPPLTAEPWTPAASLTDSTPADPTLRRAKPVIAVFGGPAFSFTYAENVEQLTAAGAAVVVVDPLRSGGLPAGTSALVIGGGFPEMHVTELAKNRRLLGEVAHFARTGGPVVAECAGLLYLGRALDGHPLAGVLPMSGAMTPKLTLGYRRATAVADSPIVRAGEQVAGHEFHRTAVAWDDTRPAWTWPVADGSTAAEGWAGPTVHASYLHVHGAGHPEQAVRLVEAARDFARALLDVTQVLERVDLHFSETTRPQP
ncbi:cobyrinate a,c-diamide synthase [Nocardioides speluncae]|uniref:cobyrinate a,c-diamide synthase n=1 Tax=Nocardioides speluncae TaxID=2670337 RepID=UPI000D689FD0|nr:cobyrinate a,c-diamide synthase [Nocardioides speluncae]